MSILTSKIVTKYIAFKLFRLLIPPKPISRFSNKTYTVIRPSPSNISKTKFSKHSEYSGS